FYLYMSQVLKKVIKNSEIELIHAQNILTIPPSIIAAKKAQIPVIGTIRDYWPICFKRSFIRPDGKVCNGCNAKNLINCINLEGALFSFSMPITIPYVYANLSIKQLLLNRADHIIAVSAAVREHLLTRQPFDKLQNFSRLSPQKISVIPNIMPVPSKTLTQSELLTMRHSYNFDENDILILYVGQLTYGKGVLTLIQATKHLLQKNPSVKLVILGTGPLIDYIKKTSNSIGDQLRYYGFLPYNEVLKFYQLADIIVSPSIWPEPLSRVIIEAMALGRPVIATNVGGTPEIITHEKNGILIEPDDHKGIENALYRLTTDPDLRSRIGLEGRKTIENQYSEVVICNQTLSIYNKVLDNF
ncbi:MAG: glycosyltransferase family 4 protein, partial [Promethearchaeota archaeon]